MLPQNVFYLDERGLPDLAGSELYGHATTEDAVILGTPGLRAWQADHPAANFPAAGRHVGLFLRQNPLHIRTDETGQETLYLWQDGARWAVSNSFLLLAVETARRARLAPYPPAILGFFLKDGRHVGEQPLGHGTPVAGIRLLPLTDEIVVDRATGRLSVVARPFAEVFALRGSPEEEMIALLEEGAGMLAALAGTGAGMNLLLSGGYDSRVVLGMLMLGGAGGEAGLRVTSHSAKSGDFRSAEALCRRFGLPLNAPAPPPAMAELSAPEALRLWLLSCAGTYMPLYMSRNLRLDPHPELRLTGDQPTGWTFFDGRARFNGPAGKIAEDIRAALADRPGGAAVAEDFLATVDASGLGREHPGAMLANYAQIRSRLHCGRNWYKSHGRQRLFTPLMSRRIVALDLHFAAQGAPPQRIFADLFSALGRWAVETPFESPERALPQDLLDASPFRGGLRLTPRPMRVYGAGAPLPPPPPDLASVPFPVRFRDDEVRPALAHAFYMADAARGSGFFTPADLDAARDELAGDGPLASSLRRVSHVVQTDTILRAIAGSGGGAG